MTAIDQALGASARAHPAPGFVAAAARGEDIVYRGAHGWRDEAGKTPMTTDAVFRIYSMTKAVTSAAVMQLVERGAIALDDPAGRYASEIAGLKVLDGFEESGAPRLRNPSTPVTIRHLLTHSAGFGYDMWNADLGRYAAATGAPSLGVGQKAALMQPLLFDPGEKWEYGISTDWAGQIVERVSGQTLDQYFSDNIFAPLGMTSTAFVATPSMAERMATLHHRAPDGGLEPLALPSPPWEYCSGGGGLLSTADDYLTFLQMIAQDGAHRGVRILAPETVNAMARVEDSVPRPRKLRSTAPFLTNDLDIWGDEDVRWSLAFLVNARRGVNGRPPGSLAWAGLANSYYWIDRDNRLAGVFMTQVLPFADKNALAIFGDFEKAVYSASPA